MIRTDVPSEGAEGLSTKVQKLLEQKAGKGAVEIRSVEMVGPKVGKDLRNAAIWATIIALGMLNFS